MHKTELTRNIERLQTIFAQTYPNWELIIFDNYSEDEAWEFFQTAARSDERLRIAQAPREGMYANWNNCIRAARGEFIYVATSDDTMPPNFLGEMVAALERHPECDLAHCKLRAFDENGHDVPDWWSRHSTFAQSSGELLDRPHIRLAPFDGLLHFLGSTVYTSITQLLIRRSLFARIGLFESRWGSIGDFNWEMRAALVAHTVHVTTTWGGWRQHADQATARASLGSAEHRAKIDEMITEAIKSSNSLLEPRIRNPLESQLTARMSDLRAFLPRLNAYRSPAKRRAFLATHILSGSWPARQHVLSRLNGAGPLPEAGPQIIRTWMKRRGIAKTVVAL